MGIIINVAVNDARYKRTIVVLPCLFCVKPLSQDQEKALVLVRMRLAKSNNFVVIGPVGEWIRRKRYHTRPPHIKSHIDRIIADHEIMCGNMLSNPLQTLRRIDSTIFIYDRSAYNVTYFSYERG